MAVRGLCSIPDCDNPHFGRRWCRKHYKRWYKHGSPTGGRIPIGGLPKWLADHASWDADECLTWPFGRDKWGYGQLRYQGTMHYASRVISLFAHGPAPTPEHEAAHSCGKGHEGCVNPRHLRWATREENDQDRRCHGRTARGTKIAQGKLTEESVRAIRALKGKMTNVEAGKLFSVGPSVICRVQTRKGWAWLD